MNRMKTVVAIAGLWVVLPSVSAADESQSKFDQCRQEMVASLFPIQNSEVANEGDDAQLMSGQISVDSVAEAVGQITEAEEIAALDSEFTALEQEGQLIAANDTIEQTSVVPNVGNEMGITAEPEIEKEPEPQIYSYRMESGLLKTQVNNMITELFPEYTPFWGNYKGRHEWFGDFTIEHADRWKILDSIMTTFGIKVKVAPNYVIEFIYTKG